MTQNRAQAQFHPSPREFQLNRRGFLRATGVLAGAGVLGGVLSACGGGGSDPSGTVGGELTLLAWDGYQAEQAVAPFLKEKDVSLTLNPLGSNDEILTKLKAGGLGHIDLATPNVGYVPQLVAAGLLQPIDFSRIPNAAKLIPSIAKTASQSTEVAGQTYALPYFWGLDGMVYNATKISSPPTSWRDVLNPEYKGKVLMIAGANANFEVWPRVLGYAPATLTADQLQDTVDFLIELKKTQVRAIVSDPANAADILARGDAWIVASGTFIGLPDNAPKGDELAYVLPAEGGATWIDSWVIPKDAPNLTTAYAYLDQVIGKNVQVALGDEFLEGTVNSEAVPAMSSANQKLFQYSSGTVGSSAAPLFQIPSGEDGVVSYADLVAAWAQVEAA